jgi:hypothetical protein
MDFEEGLFETIRSIADRFGWELTKRDPGPDCEYCDTFERDGFMPPIHECPQDAPWGGNDFDLTVEDILNYNRELGAD